ncbi:MAG: 50S ribosomal protein L3 [Firmicutes bacterium]|nr:50S ribosomal protein L3 [Bacillota bacterium]
MPKGILGRKLGMTQIFTETGVLLPVTVIEAGPCPVVQVKTEASDGYNAIQIGFEEKPERRTTKPLQGHFAKAGLKPCRVLRELRAEDAAELDGVNVGQEITVDIFESGDYVDVTGISKGKGFAGVVKRWNFGRGPMSHGSMYHRRVGSLGDTGAARVFKGRKLPGRMGGEQVTIQGLQIVRVDPERNLLLVRGSVPGPKGGVVLVRESVKRRKKKGA